MVAGSALALAFAGSDGVTREQMANVLHFPKDDLEVQRSFAALRNALDGVVQESVTNAVQAKQWGATNDPITLTVANRLFGQSGYDFRASFLELVNSLETKLTPAPVAKNTSFRARDFFTFADSRAEALTSRTPARFCWITGGVFQTPGFCHQNLYPPAASRYTPGNEFAVLHRATRDRG
jgi:hypothetical protein